LAICNAIHNALSLSLSLSLSNTSESAAKLPLSPPLRRVAFWCASIPSMSRQG
jgi:hypothetical protein